MAILSQRNPYEVSEEEYELLEPYLSDEASDSDIDEVPEEEIMKQVKNLIFLDWKLQNEAWPTLTFCFNIKISVELL